MKTRGFPFIGAIFTCLVVWCIFRLVTIPGFAGTAMRARELSCHATLRCIKDGIDMYNRDHPLAPIDEFEADLIPKLIAGKYLTGSPSQYRCPGGYTMPSNALEGLYYKIAFQSHFIEVPPGFFMGGNFLGTGTMACSWHGPPPGP